MTLRPKEVLSDPAATTVPPAPRARPAPVSWGLLAVCVVMFFLQDKLARPVAIAGDAAGGPLLPWGALFGPSVRAGQWWRLVSYALEHGDAIHLLFNSTGIWSLGTALERVVGSWRFFVITLASTLGCAALALLANFEAPLVGASGAILGWAAALLPLLTAQGRKSLMWMLAQVAVISLLPGVSLAGHLGGFLFGLPFGLALRMGPRVFSRAAPFLLFLSGVVAVLSTNPKRLT
jgi:rhomboid protease GluP